MWLARNVVGTLRAVKIVRRDRHASAESVEREFKGLQKFEPVSRSHDGLVDILTLGLLPDGAGFYYVMELADDAKVAQASSLFEANEKQLLSETGKMPVPPYTPRTLRAELKSRGALPADEVIALALKLTAALAHLHAQGLVHRDVKPSNILFIGGEPKLADAGLVAAVDDARSLVGTAGYIAPEGPGTPQADLYALGKVLYEAAFGKDRQEFPALPADVASRPDHTCLLELNAILLKACATERRKRYLSADQMRADLELLQAGRSVKRRHIWQHTLALAKKLALAGAGLLVMSVVVYWLSIRQLRSLNMDPARPPAFVWSTNQEANEEYHSGNVSLHSGPGGFEAIKHFEQAIAKDPFFAEAYARLAYAWISSGATNSISQARTAAEKAVSLDPKSSAGHAFLASVKIHELDWDGAERERTLALGLNPNSEEILLESALNLAVMGRTNESLAILGKSFRANADAASNLRVFYSGLVYLLSRQYDRIIEIYDRFPNCRNWLREEPRQPRALQSPLQGHWIDASRLQSHLLVQTRSGVAGSSESSARKKGRPIWAMFVAPVTRRHFLSNLPSALWVAMLTGQSGVVS